MRLLIALGLVAVVSAYPPSSLYKGNNTKPLDWWENTVFYQIYPRSFKDGDGDGVGDIKGIISKLDYLEELGVGGTWLSPIFKSPMKDFGYDISDFYAIDPLFGTMEDAEELFRQANARGLKIILDFVPNHSSDQCEWFQKSVKRIEPYTDYYVWRDGKNETGVMKPPNNWDNAFYGTAWEWNDERQQYYFHSFAPDQPDLNFRNPLVAEEMKNVLRFWVNKGAAGFRVDATDHIFEDAQFRDEPLSGETDDPLNYKYTKKDYTRNVGKYPIHVYEWREVLDSLYNVSGGYTKILMTETYSNNSVYRRYYQTDDGKRQGSHVPLNHILIMNLTEYFTAHDIKDLVDIGLGGVPDGKFASWIVGNHDRRRIGSLMGEGKIDCFMTLVMTLPGVAITYQGEELGMLEYRNGLFFNQTFDPQAIIYGEKGQWREWTRDPVRTPYQWDGSKYAGFSDVKPWLPIHPNYKEVNLAKQRKAKRSTFKYWNQLKEFRKQNTLIYGDFNSVVVGSNVLAYSRSLEGHDTYVVLLNLGSAEETIDVHEVAKGLNEYVEIVLAGAETPYNIGDILPTNAVFLRKFNAVVVKSAPHHYSSANPSPGTSFMAVAVSTVIALCTIF